MDDIAEQFAIRDSFRRKMALRKTPEQRMTEMAERQRLTSERGGMLPEGYANFLRRNFRKRAIDVRGLHDA
ncbi:MAG TPA: hypothetical protein VFE47_31755 [Tepidisphaeraceae bacterium]|nr:hypothetical protein [Tepidisphaeraceae bacterium]